jgi:hypothetical protein
MEQKRLTIDLRRITHVRGRSRWDSLASAAPLSTLIRLEFRSGTLVAAWAAA